VIAVAEPTPRQRLVEVAEHHAMLYEGRAALRSLLALVFWVIELSARRVDPTGADVARAALRAVCSALQLEDDLMGSKDPDPTIAPDEGAFRIVIGRGSPAFHRPLRAMTDDELDQLFGAVQAVDLEGAEAVRDAVQLALAEDLRRELDDLAIELQVVPDDLWKRFADNVRVGARRWRCAVLVKG